MHDASMPHFVDELALAVRAGPGRTRHVHLVLENDANDAARLERGADGRARLADAQWNDDVHHALHVLATGERDGYYLDYADDPRAHLARALAEGYAYQGEPSRYREGEPRGTPSTALPPVAFVASTQTHDQVGNRAHGERLAALADAAGHTAALRALTACVLLAPQIPMLFMGEEWAASTPFLYFCDYAGELARAVAELQKRQQDAGQSIDDRLRKLEPAKVSVDGREFVADPEEKRAYDEAMSLLRMGDFGRATAALASFQKRYPSSGYADSVRFWLGNAQYGQRNYKDAVATFRAFVSAAPTNPRAPEAMLALANSQAEMKDLRGARRTLEDLLKTYPQSEAAVAGRERLAALK
jgi:tol-pal system protein YbgF